MHLSSLHLLPSKIFRIQREYKYLFLKKLKKLKRKADSLSQHITQHRAVRKIILFLKTSDNCFFFLTVIIEVITFSKGIDQENFNKGNEQ